jgi:hypothetical protein
MPAMWHRNLRTILSRAKAGRDAVCPSQAHPQARPFSGCAARALLKTNPHCPSPASTMLNSSASFSTEQLNSWPPPVTTSSSSTSTKKTRPVLSADLPMQGGVAAWSRPPPRWQPARADRVRTCGSERRGNCIRGILKCAMLGSSVQLLQKGDRHHGRVVSAGWAPLQGAVHRHRTARPHINP